MTIERLGFVDHFILLAERSRCEATSRSGLRFIEGKVASLIDRILSAISSSYREYRVNLLNRFSTTQPPVADKVKELVHPIFVPPSESLSEQSQNDRIFQPQAKSEEEVVDSGEKGTGNSDGLFDESDLNNLFGFFNEEAPILKEDGEKKSATVESDGMIISDSNPKVLSLEDAEDKDSGSLNIEEMPVDQTIGAIEEKNATVKEIPLGADQPILPMPEELEQMEELSEVENAVEEEKILTEEEFFAMVQLLWLKQYDTFNDLPDGLKRQFGMHLVNNLGLLSGFFAGLQAMDYLEKDGLPLSSIEERFVDLASLEKIEQGPTELIEDVSVEMDVGQLFTISEEDSDEEDISQTNSDSDSFNETRGDGLSVGSEVPIIDSN